MLAKPGQLLRFLQELYSFTRLGGKVVQVRPLLGDYQSESALLDPHYFAQDILVAQKIYRNSPDSHIDVGSRVDGLVAHLAVFRKVDVVDIRPSGVQIQNIDFIQKDITDGLGRTSDSVSSLHTIEHIGLGRYSDPLDPEGHLKAFQSLCNAVQPGGVLYISFPISNRERTVFNANRIFNPNSIFTWPGADEFDLEEFDWIDDRAQLWQDSQVEKALKANLDEGLGIYTLRKKKFPRS